MEQKHATDLLVALVLGNTAGLVGKIVWDYLRIRREGEGAAHRHWTGCPLHAECREDLQKCEGGLMELRQGVGRHEVLINEHNKSLSRELLKGERLFDQILQAVQQLKEQYASQRERLAQIERQLNRMDGKPANGAMPNGA